MIFGDPDAADIVFTCGADVLAVGINVTHQIYLLKIREVYFNYHHDAYNTKVVYLHDPIAMLAAINPSLITYEEGAIRVQKNGNTRGLTLLYNKQKRWSDQPFVKVAVTVDASAVIKLVMERLME
ncbi:hypothetical protein V6Z12_A07G151300 [Gossypium hirsutum]